MSSPVVVLLLAAGLAAVHAFASKLRLLRVIPRSQYLSLAGGISVAYVFVHLLPEITEHQAEIMERSGETARLVAATSERALFLVALAGFAVFYGLERLVVQSRRRSHADRRAGDDESEPHPGIFWLHVGSFAVYNVLIGYFLLHREETGLVNLLLYTTAMALHFVVNDHGLREHHRRAYLRWGRWILAGAVFVGAFVGLFVGVPETLLGLLLAFLSGGVILNVIKEELPENRESNFWAFGVGVAGYTTVLLLV